MDAKLVVIKSVDKLLAYVGDTLKYSVSVKNTGDVDADNVVIIDSVPVGTTLVPGSLNVSVPHSGSLASSVTLTNPVAPDEIVVMTFETIVPQVPNPNPITNKAVVEYDYDEGSEIVEATSTSNIVKTFVPRYNFGQQITDIIESISLEQAALAAIANSEGAKIQAAVAMADITNEELLCINKSVQDALDSIAMLESILKQKLNLLNCQINPYCM